MVDLNSDGLEDIVMGAPGQVSLDSGLGGCVYVIFGRTSWAHPLPEGDVDVDEVHSII